MNAANLQDLFLNRGFIQIKIKFIKSVILKALFY